MLQIKPHDRLVERTICRSRIAYGTEPNAFFKAQLDQLTPGRLLLPAEGEGRNAVYAAKKGWEVAAFAPNNF